MKTRNMSKGLARACMLVASAAALNFAVSAGVTSVARWLKGLG